MTVNPNAMQHWPEITCQRDHDTHTTRRVRVDLARRHGYHDWPPVPPRLARAFTMDVYDPDLYPVDGGPYCPAHDAVSETIVSHLIWEPCETILTLHVCETAPADSIMVDFGAQIGWFSLLAASCGLGVKAVDADAVNLEVAWRSAQANGWGGQVVTWHERVGPATPPQSALDQRIRLLKIDVEGAENDAVRVLWPSIEAGLVDHLLVEISPVFADYYPDLVDQIIAAGYRCFVVPEKHQPPPVLDDIERDMAPFELTTLLSPRELHRYTANLRQANYWFQRIGASW